jgi:hypothetical protein
MKDRTEVRLSSGDTGFLNKGCPWTGINEYCIESPLGSLTHYDRKQVTVVRTEKPIQLGDIVRVDSVYTGRAYTGRVNQIYYSSGNVCIILDEAQHGEEAGYRVSLTPKSVVWVKDPVDKPELKTTSRQEVIDEASKLIHSDRNASYGEPTQNFKDTAALWNIQFGHKLKEPLTSTDVAQAMILLKMARMKASPKKDNWADAIGYAACGFECDVSEGRISE